MSVVTDLSVLRHQDRPVLSGRRHDELIGRIAWKRLGQLTTFYQNRTRQLRQMQTRQGGGQIEPLIERPIQHELALLEFLGELPYRDQ